MTKDPGDSGIQNNFFFSVLGMKPKDLGMLSTVSTSEPRPQLKDFLIQVPLEKHTAIILTRMETHEPCSFQLRK
jgi:hypothetical protein